MFAEWLERFRFAACAVSLQGCQMSFLLSVSLDCSDWLTYNPITPGCPPVALKQALLLRDDVELVLQHTLGTLQALRITPGVGTATGSGRANSGSIKR